MSAPYIKKEPVQVHRQVIKTGGKTPHHDAFISSCIDKEYQTTRIKAQRSPKESPVNRVVCMLNLRQQVRWFIHKIKPYSTLHGCPTTCPRLYSAIMDLLEASRWCGLIPLRKELEKCSEYDSVGNITIICSQLQCKIQILYWNSSKMITNCPSKITCGWRATKVSSPVLPLCNCVENSILDTSGFVMKLQMAQHCYRTQQQSSWIRQILHKFNHNKYDYTLFHRRLCLKKHRVTSVKWRGIL